MVGAFSSVGSLNPFFGKWILQSQVLTGTHKMAELVDKIENVMRTVNPFVFTSLGGGDYYYEANNMVRLLPTYTGTILELCMDSFDIYYDHHPKWTELETAISELFSKQ